MSGGARGGERGCQRRRGRGLCRAARRDSQGEEQQV